MSERMTSINLPGLFGAGYADRDSKTVAEMIALIRRNATAMKRDAEAILSANDTDFRVETYLGVYVCRNREVLQEGKPMTGTPAAQVRAEARATQAAETDEGTNATSVPNRIGMSYQGGFYAGRIVIDGKAYALVVAPKAEGQKILPWKNDWTKTDGASSLNDGFANSEAMNNDDHPAAQFCRGLTIGGFTDWYLPSRDELEICYRNLKPGPDENYTYANRADWWGFEPGQYNGVDEAGNGANPASDPAGVAYTAALPSQTAAEAFRGDQGEAFDRRWYWSSSEFDQTGAWGQDIDDGDQDNVEKRDGNRVRAVRKVLILII